MIPACLTHTQSEHVKLNVVQLAAKDEYVAAARTAGAKSRCCGKWEICDMQNPTTLHTAECW